MSDFGFDPSIILSSQARAPQNEALAVESMRNGMAMAQQRQQMALQQQQLAQQQQMQQATLGEMLYRQQRQRSLADITRGTAGVYSDPAAQAYAQGGFGAEAQEMQDKAAARQMNAQKLLDLHANIARSQATTIKTPEQYDRWASRMPADLRSMYGLPDTYDPDALKAFITSGISPEKQVENDLKRQELNKGRYDIKSNPVTGSTRKIDQLTGDVTTLEGGTGTAPGSVPAGKPLQVADYREKVLSKLGEDLDPTKGKANLPAKAQAQIAAAERFDTLLNAPGPMTNQRLHEATMMAATIANGGNQPTEAMVESMFPKTLRGRGAEFWQSVTNAPMDAGAGAFVDQLRNQSEREMETGKKQIRQYLLNRLSKHPQAFQEFPEDAGRMAEAAGLKGLYDSKTLLPLKTPSHPQDAEAVKWAKNNLNDPKLGAKAKAILSANGVQ